MIVVRVFGVEVLAIGRDKADDGPGDAIAEPRTVGFYDSNVGRWGPPPGGDTQ